MKFTNFQYFLKIKKETKKAAPNKSERLNSVKSNYFTFILKAIFVGFAHSLRDEATLVFHIYRRIFRKAFQAH